MDGRKKGGKEPGENFMRWVGVKKEDIYSHSPHNILPGLPRRGVMGQDVGGKSGGKKEDGGEIEKDS